MDDGYGVVASVEHLAQARLATIRLGTAPETPEQDVVVDLFASSGVEGEIVASAEPLEVLPGLVVPVAVAGHLIAIKLLARDDEHRPQDLADLRSLLTAATTDDLETARAAVELIAGRGFDRGRDLAAALEELLKGGPPA